MTRARSIVGSSHPSSSPSASARPALRPGSAKDNPRPRKAKRPRGPVRGGGHGRQDPVHLGQGRLSPQRRVPGEGRELPGRDPQDAAVGRPRHEARRQVVRLPRRPRQVRRDEQVLRQVLPGGPAGADDAGRRPGARRLAARDHLHRLQRPRREEAHRRRPARASRSARASWRATRSMSRARAISSPTAAIPRPSRSRSARRCGTSRRRSSRPGWTSGTSS